MGRSRWGWEFATYTNFGEARKRIVARHFSLAAADRAFKRLRRIYSHERRQPGYEKWRCWQENRAGDHIINDTKELDQAVYA